MTVFTGHVGLGGHPVRTTAGVVSAKPPTSAVVKGLVPQRNVALYVVAVHVCPIGRRYGQTVARADARDRQARPANRFVTARRCSVVRTADGSTRDVQTDVCRCRCRRGRGRRYSTSVQNRSVGRQAKSSVPSASRLLNAAPTAYARTARVVKIDTSGYLLIYGRWSVNVDPSGRSGRSVCPVRLSGCFADNVSLPTR